MDRPSCSRAHYCHRTGERVKSTRQPSPDTLRAAVEKALRRRSGLTVAGAFELGCTHLPSIVLRLRRAGLVIDAQWHAGVNRYGRVTRYKKYRALQP